MTKLSSVASLHVLGFLAFGQVPEPAVQSQPVFETVSVKRSAPDQRPAMGRLPGGRFIATSTLARVLVESAYGTNRHSGGPKWFYDDRFDVTAEPGRSASPEEFRPMLQNLLAERFKLKVHWEEQKATIYGLRVDKGSVKMQKVQADDPSLKRGFPSTRLSKSSSRISVSKATMPAFAEWLALVLDAPVVDETQLSDSFRFVLDYAIPNAPPEEDPTAVHAASIFTALQEQLGLRLEARKGTTQVLIIDHIEKPTDN